MRGLIGGILAAGATFLVLGALAADDDPKPRGPDHGALFEQLDKNHDGQIDKSEVPPEKTRLFERLLRNADKDGNKALTREEFIAGLKDDRPERGEDRDRPERPLRGGPEPEEMFRRLDTNGDGKIASDEVPEDRRAMFERLIGRADKDGDGALSKEEFVAGIRAFRGQDGDSPAGRDEVLARFKRWDKNGDGKVTLDEVPEEARPRFERLLERGDKNGEKALDVEEFKHVLQENGPRGAKTPEAIDLTGAAARTMVRAVAAPVRPPDDQAACSPRSTPTATASSAKQKSRRPLQCSRSSTRTATEKFHTTKPWVAPHGPPPRDRGRDERARDERGRDDSSRFDRPDFERDGPPGPRFMMTMLERHFDEMDADGDGVVDRHEFMHQAERMVHRMERFAENGPPPRRMDDDRGGDFRRDRRPPPPDEDDFDRGPRQRGGRGEGRAGRGQRPDGPPEFGGRDRGGPPDRGERGGRPDRRGFGPPPDRGAPPDREDLGFGPPDRGGPPPDDFDDI